MLLINFSGKDKYRVENEKNIIESSIFKYEDEEIKKYIKVYDIERSIPDGNYEFCVFIGTNAELDETVICRYVDVI